MFRKKFRENAVQLKAHGGYTILAFSGKVKGFSLSLRGHADGAALNNEKENLPEVGGGDWSRIDFVAVGHARSGEQHAG